MLGGYDGSDGGHMADKVQKIDQSELLRKQQEENRERTAALERARLEHAQREQTILNQQRQREDQGQGES